MVVDVNRHDGAAMLQTFRAKFSVQKTSASLAACLRIIRAHVEEPLGKNKGDTQEEQNKVDVVGIKTLLHVAALGQTLTARGSNVQRPRFTAAVRGLQLGFNVFTNTKTATTVIRPDDVNLLVCSIDWTGGGKATCS